MIENPNYDREERDDGRVDRQWKGGNRKRLKPFIYAMIDRKPCLVVEKRMMTNNRKDWTERKGRNKASQDNGRQSLYEL